MASDTHRRSIDFRTDIYSIINARAMLNKRTFQKEVESLIETALALQDVELTRIVSVVKRELQSDV